ncbi:MAG: UDP-glucose/GDP-mannose dehydrogenase family protein [Rhizobiaceae bacterium]
MKVLVLGTGYVGLVTGACLASWGHQVVCADIDEGKVADLNAGRLPIFEPGLAEHVANGGRSGLLTFTADCSEHAAGVDLAFICVGTPAGGPDKSADLSAVYTAALELGEVLSDGSVIVTKSTVPVGTGDEIEQIIHRLGRSGKLVVASNPEFLREGTAVSDFNNPDRIVIGANHRAAGDRLQRLYQPLSAAGVPVMVTRRNAAELIKYAANAFLATKITFINEIADLCEKARIDVSEISAGIGLDSRIGSCFLEAGPGYGGSCFPKDTLTLLKTGEQLDVPLSIVRQTVLANDARKLRMAEKAKDAAGGSVDGMRIAVLGLAFKSGTDDVRESPALSLIENLQREGAEIHAFDPQAAKNAQRILSDVTYHDCPNSCAEDADLAVVVTDWPVIRQLELESLGKIMRSPTVVDLRGIFDPNFACRHGIRLISLGRPEQVQSGLYTDLLTREDNQSKDHPDFRISSVDSFDAAVS